MDMLRLLLWSETVLDLEGIIARWKYHAEAVPIHKHPTVWVAHYGTSEQSMFDQITSGPQARTTELLGSLAATEPISIPGAVMLLGSPWSTVAEIHETVLVADIDRMLHVTHFVDEGRVERSADWRVPYGMADDGSLLFDVAMRCRSALWRECHLLWENRIVGKGKRAFDEAFTAAMEMGEQLL